MDGRRVARLWTVCEHHALHAAFVVHVHVGKGCAIMDCNFHLQWMFSDPI